MVKISDLKKYKNSEEFTNIVKKCDNNIESIENKIYSYYVDGDIDNEPKYSEYDVQFQRIQMLERILEEVLGETVGSEELMKLLEEDIKNLGDFIKRRIKNEYGLLYSSKQYTDIDLLRYKSINYEIMKLKVDEMINKLEKPKKEKDDSVY